MVAAYLQAETIDNNISDGEIKQWVQTKLARHKTPEYIFWVGDPEVGDSLPLTGSGKVKKNLLRDMGNAILTSRKSNEQRRMTRARL